MNIPADQAFPTAWGVGDAMQEFIELPLTAQALPVGFG
jgi:hypothetical protein